MDNEILTRLIEEVSSLRMELMECRKQPSIKMIYTNKDLEKMFGVTSQTLKKWRNSGFLGFSKSGNVISYTYNDVQTFMKNTHRSAYFFE